MAVVSAVLLPNTRPDVRRGRHEASRLREASALAARDGFVNLTLPEPPSINHYWRVARGITHLSIDGRRWKTAACEIARKAGLVVLDGPVAVSITWYRSRRSGDLDNRIKVVLDVLRGLAYHDDKQVVELHAWRYEDKKAPRVEVEIWNR